MRKFNLTLNRFVSIYTTIGLSFMVILPSVAAENLAPSAASQVETYRQAQQIQTTTLPESIALKLPNENSAYQSTNPEVREFIKKAASEYFNFRLNSQELLALLEFSKKANQPISHLIYTSQIEKLKTIETSKSQPLNVDKEIVSAQFLQQEAHDIVAKMMAKNNLEEITLELLSLLRCYATQPSLRGACQLMLNAIESYNFPPQQLKELRKQSTALQKYAQGSFYGGLFVLAASIINFKKYGHYLSKLLPASKKSMQTTTLAKIEKMLENETEVERALREIDELMMSRAQKYAHRAQIVEARATKTIIDETIGLSRSSFFKNMTSLRQSDWARDLMIFLGISQGVGLANVGFHALKDVYAPENTSNSITSINVTDGYHRGEANTANANTPNGLVGRSIKKDLYDGLAVLHSSCVAFDLLKASEDSASAEKNLNFHLFELSSLYVDFFMLKKMAEQYTEIVMLPKEIKANRSTGTIDLEFKIKNETKKESFLCPKARTFSSDRVEVSLNEVLAMIAQTYINLANIEASMKARNLQPKTK